MLPPLNLGRSGGGSGVLGDSAGWEIISPPALKGCAQCRHALAVALFSWPHRGQFFLPFAIVSVLLWGDYTTNFLVVKRLTVFSPTFGVVVHAVEIFGTPTPPLEFVHVGFFGVLGKVTFQVLPCLLVAATLDFPLDVA
jgi:hypothetical protein